MTVMMPGGRQGVRATFDLTEWNVGQVVEKMSELMVREDPSPCTPFRVTFNFDTGRSGAQLSQFGGALRTELVKRGMRQCGNPSLLQVYGTQAGNFCMNDQIIVGWITPSAR